MRLMNCVTALAAVIVSASAVASPLSAQGTHAARTRLLILDLAPADPLQPNANRVFSISETDANGTVDNLRCHLDALRAKLALTECNGQMLGAVRGREAEGVLKFIRASGKQLALRNSARWVSRKGDSVQVYVFHPAGSDPVLAIKETPRKSRISTDLHTLGKIGLKIGGLSIAAVNGNRETVAFSFKQHHLTESRAVLTVGGNLGGMTLDASDTQLPPELTTSITTGPKEHLFLSANAALTELRQTHYNSTTKTFDLDEKPKEFLIGVNYVLGDLLQDEAPATLKRFVSGTFVSLLLEASRTPFDQVGATIGFRHSPPKLGSFISFETVSPYVGLIWARNDHAAKGDPVRVESSFGKRSIVWGLSLNLDKALGWLGT